MINLNFHTAGATGRWPVRFPHLHSHLLHIQYTYIFELKCDGEILFDSAKFFSTTCLPI